MMGIFVILFGIFCLSVSKSLGIFAIILGVLSLFLKKD
jgi:hypothetical protein